MEQNKFYQIKNITEHEYTLVGCDGSVITRPIQDVDRLASAFTIHDAMDGDVLLFEGFYNSIVLFQGIGINGKGRINYHCKCDLMNYSFGVQGDFACLGTIEKDAEHYHPATKEQRDLLFQKMKEAEYIFDFEKKELKKLSQSEVTKTSDQEEIAEIPFGAKDSELQEATYFIPKGFHAEIKGDIVLIKKGKQKFEWSEEDEHRLKDTIYFLDTAKKHYASTVELDACIDWLKSLKPHKQWKPSDEQMLALEAKITIPPQSPAMTSALIELYQQLKKL